MSVVETHKRLRRAHDGWDMPLYTLPFLLSNLMQGTYAKLSAFDVAHLLLVLMQVNPGEFSSLADGISKIYKSSGFNGVMQGALPTTIGFLLQGSLKYGFYEYFKDNLALRTQVQLSQCHFLAHEFSLRPVCI